MLNEWQKCLAILRWSALPGASRHHWGTEIDVFDPDLLPKGQSLQLEPQEYQQNGYFAPLVEFLQQHLSDFDFYLPFLELPQDKKVGVEPWHISYRPIAEKLQPLLTLDVLLEAWKDETIAGKRSSLNIFKRFSINLFFNQKSVRPTLDCGRTLLFFRGRRNSFQSFDKNMIQRKAIET